MRSFTELSKVKKAADGSGSFLIRWRGKQEGPYSESIIDNKLTTNEISLIHEIFYNGQWILIRDYIAAKKTILEAQHQEREKNEQLLQEERDHHTHQNAEPQNVFQDTNPSITKSSYKPLFDSPVVKKAVRGFIVVACICAALWLVLALISSVATTRQRLDPNLRQATKKAWRDIQVAETQSVSTTTDWAEYFNQIAANYTQIDADDADPELKDYIVKRLGAAKTLREIFMNLQSDLQKNAADREGLSKLSAVFGQALGAILSAQKDSNVSVESGMQLGQFFGNLSGSAAGLALIPDEEIKAKYTNQLNAAIGAYDQLSQNKLQLGKRLGEKYKILLLDASN